MKRFIPLILLSILLLPCCEEDPLAKDFVPPTVKLDTPTPEAYSTVLSATLTGKVSVKECGFYVGTDKNLSGAGKRSAELNNSTFSCRVSDLAANTTYYYSAYISSGKTEIESEAGSFTTASTTADVVTTPITNVTSNGAMTGGSIAKDGGSAITARGVCWSTSRNPTVALATKTSNGTGAGTFTSSITSLSPGTTYYVRAYATNSVGTSYGEEKTFNTLTTVSTVITTSITLITPTSAVSGGNITSDGGATVTARGVCWSTSENPTISDSKTSDGTGTGIFTSNITGLTRSTTYYVRAYATNSVGTSYGEQKSFTTSHLPPAITTTEVTSVSATTATSGGNVISDGGVDVTVRGVCWSTSENPTIADSKTEDGTGTGEFTSTITGLTHSTTYYVRAYATNSEGTSYGEEKSFTTLHIVPTVTSADVTSVTSTTATSGGNVTADGGATVTARGVCWSTSENPTISDSKTSDGTGVGEFTSSITSLSPGTTYYLRAYATNSVGTSYGEQKTFTTNKEAPTVTTTDVTSITVSTAVSGGNVTSDGGAPVTARGICWSTAQNPTVANSKTTNGTGTGTFIGNLTGLAAGTTYYVRAYATNSIGTSYGSQKSFKTKSSGENEGSDKNNFDFNTNTSGENEGSGRNEFEW